LTDDSTMTKGLANIRRLDFAQLAYLRAVARTGSVTAAAESLHVTPQTVSGQVGVLEARLGVALLERVGRGVRLTDVAGVVLQYADDILGRGEDLLRALESVDAWRPPTFRVGVGRIVPKLVAHRFLRPVLKLAAPPRLVVREGEEEDLFEQLRSRRLDAVVSSGYTPDGTGLATTELAATRLGVFATPALARRFRRGFPRSLAGAPVLLPGAESPVRRFLDAWLAGNGIAPRVVGEFDDAGQREAFGVAGDGLFFAPDLIADDLRRQYGVVKIGRLPDVWVRYFLVTPVRAFTPPAELAIRPRPGPARGS
jgi:LysR family transcriptional activator of nhaA